MLFFYILSNLFLFLSYASNNPLISCFSLIASMIGLSPVLVTLMPCWMVLLFIISFLTGILVVVLYFTSVSMMSFLYVPRTIFIMPLALFMFPVLMTSVKLNWFFSLFNMTSFPILMLLILSLSMLVVFASYMLSHSSAMRNM